MRPGLPSVILVLLGACAGVLLSACGSATKTVSVSGPPAGSQTGSASVPSTSTGSASAPAATAPSSQTPAQQTDGGTAAPEGGATSTRTAPEPAFAEHGAGAEGLGAATAVLQEKGFTPTDTSQYRPGQTLRVLIGSRTASDGGNAQQAFFFVNGRYVGTDTSEPSGRVSVVEQGDTEVTLAYGLYKEGEPLCCPSGGQATVRFELNNGTLTPLDPIPPVRSSTGLSRQ
jgi:LppP/LprE lipoprotein